MDDFTILKAAIKESTTTDSSEIINSSLEIDGRLNDIFANCPPDWQYESAYTTTNTDLLCDGYYDIYHNDFVSRKWNGMRATRIMINQTIRSCLLDGFAERPPRFSTAEYTALFQICTDNIIKLRNDILHSIPQQLGFVTSKPFQNADSSANSSPPRKHNLDICFTDMLSDPELPSQSTPLLTQPPNCLAISGYHLIWPLCKSSFLSPRFSLSKYIFINQNITLHSPPQTPPKRFHSLTPFSPLPLL
jgi:hypothetical protein